MERALKKMDIISKLLRISGKENFKIDKAIGRKYIIRQCWKYAKMLARGKVISLGYRSIAKSIFVGKKVELIERKLISIGKKSKLQDGVYIDALSTDGVMLGDYVVLGRNTRIECTGSLQKIGKGVKIGNRTTFGNDCFFGAAGGILVGEDVIAGQFIRFHSENHNYDDISKLIKVQGVTRKGIKIGDNCWIGAGVVFLDGAELGNGCVVGANSVVTKKFPDNAVVAGIPAKVIKYR